MFFTKNSSRPSLDVKCEMYVTLCFTFVFCCECDNKWKCLFVEKTKPKKDALKRAFNKLLVLYHYFNIKSKPF